MMEQMLVLCSLTLTVQQQHFSVTCMGKLLFCNWCSDCGAGHVRGSHPVEWGLHAGVKACSHLQACLL